MIYSLDQELIRAFSLSDRVSPWDSQSVDGHLLNVGGGGEVGVGPGLPAVASATWRELGLNLVLKWTHRPTYLQSKGQRVVVELRRICDTEASFSSTTVVVRNPSPIYLLRRSEPEFSSAFLSAGETDKQEIPAGEMLFLISAQHSSWDMIFFSCSFTLFGNQKLDRLAILLIRLPL